MSRKSVGAENTFFADLTEFEAMVAELQPLIDKVWRHCEDKGTRGRTVTLKVKFADFERRRSDCLAYRSPDSSTHRTTLRFRFLCFSSDGDRQILRRSRF